MGFNAYFLIVWDFVKYAKDAGIAVGPGRGSAAGSIVAYCLRITDLDPLRYDLLFERFLNPERVSMPDIDMDFSVRGRERVIRYVTEKYGKGAVAQIVTFGKMFPEAATRDAARVLGHDYGDRRPAGEADPRARAGPGAEVSTCLEVGQPLRAEVDRDGVAKQIIDVAQGLEGIVRNSSIHAAAVVISDRHLTEILPLQIAEAGTDEHGDKVYRTVTQFSMKPVEALGLLEDGLPRSTQPRRDRGRAGHRAALQRRATRHGNARPRRCQDVRDARRRRRGRRLPVRVRGHARGAQEGSSDRVQRPGRAGRAVPAGRDGLDPHLRARQADPESISYADERLRPILESTKGVIIYQEQAMQIAKDLAGFSRRQGRRPAQGDRQEEP